MTTIILGSRPCRIKSDIVIIATIDEVIDENDECLPRYKSALKMFAEYLRMRVYRL